MSCNFYGETVGLFPFTVRLLGSEQIMLIGSQNDLEKLESKKQAFVILPKFL